MKRTFLIGLCLVFCLAACVRPAPAPQPAEAPSAAPEPAADATAAPTDAPEEPAKTTEAPAETVKAPAETALASEADLYFSTTTLDGTAITSDILKDYDLVVLNFWAEWCGPCVGELPALEQIHKDHPNVLILGAWVGDNLNEAIETLQDAGVTYPAIDVRADSVLLQYATRSQYIPATYFFDKNGSEIGEPTVGSMRYEDWKQTVEELLP